MVIARGVWLVVLAGCGSGVATYRTMPVGWRGRIPSCDGATVVDARATPAPAFGVEAGAVVAIAVGRSRLRCADGSTIDVAASTIARLAIDGPPRVVAGMRALYELHAFAADGEELALADADAGMIAWTTSAGTIAPAECQRNDYGPSPFGLGDSGCPDDERTVELTGATGEVTITATVAASASTSLVVTLVP